MGAEVGTTTSDSNGSIVCSVGSLVGLAEGTTVGTIEGGELIVGAWVGTFDIVGTRLGALLGVELGDILGATLMLGATLGMTLGL